MRSTVASVINIYKSHITGFYRISWKKVINFLQISFNHNIIFEGKNIHEIYYINYFHFLVAQFQ